MAILHPNSLEFTSRSVAQTERLGAHLGQLLETHDVLCLQGELGVGKTALARGIGRGWGTPLRVTSPTFTLINEYTRPNDRCILYHLDCYRLNDAADIETLGLDDILVATGALIIEWPERIVTTLPSDHLWIKLHYVNHTHRSLHLTAQGTRSQALLDQFKHRAFGV